jgi:hypothetical protein
MWRRAALELVQVIVLVVVVLTLGLIARWALLRWLEGSS